MSAEAAPLLDIRDLGVTFETPAGDIEAVTDFSLALKAGECVGVVGESGAGKSQALLAVMGLLPPNARTRGSVRFDGRELLGLPSHEMNALRGASVSMVFQDPLTSFTPHLMIGDQIAEPLVRHTGASWGAARKRAVELLERVHVTDPARRARQFPHELSGGMRQRVMIAMALACGPKLVIADEPTTALDVTIQAQILALLAELKRERALALALITHDLGVVAGMADRVIVMRAGRIVETGTTGRVLKRPENAYTQSLLSAVPRVTAVATRERRRTSADAAAAASAAAGTRSPENGGNPAAAEPGPTQPSAARPGGTQPGGTQPGGTQPGGTQPGPAEPSTAQPIRTSDAVSRAPAHASDAQHTAHSPAPLLALSGLQVHFPTRGSLLKRGPVLRAVDGVNLHIKPGEAVGVVGESGSGKSTLARAALQLVRATAGQVVWLGNPIDASTHIAPFRRDTQLVFQDPVASLDPRMTVQEIVAEPLLVHRSDLGAQARKLAVAEMLNRVGLGNNLMTRYPHELSGGQAQRVGIARAMILRPKLLVCDEAVSALDVTVQSQIVLLLQELKRDLQTSILFISHNLAVVQQLCDRVLVLYLGRMMEQGTTDALYAKPAHPYTRGLLDSVPIPDPDVQPARLASPITGELPSPLAPPAGCVFNTRCPHARDVCRAHMPPWEAAGPDQRVACHRWRELQELQPALQP
jgi:oligopeptide/dipeptide ABC transporter ATP-binding protein